MLEKQALQLLHSFVVGSSHILLTERLASVVINWKGEVEAQQVHQLHGKRVGPVGIQQRKGLLLGWARLPAGQANAD
jgi:hypothetical protein